MHINKRVSTLFACVSLLLLSAGAWATSVTFPGPVIYNDAGVKVTPTSISVASVTDLDGVAIASPGAVAHFAGSNSSVVYDAAAKGEAWITLTPVLAGSTFTSNPPVIFCSSDTQTLQGTNSRVLTNLDAQVSTRSSHSAADVWAATSRSLTTLAGLTLPTPLAGFFTNLPGVTLAVGQSIAANNLPADYLTGGQNTKLTAASTAQQAGAAVTLPATVLQVSDLTALVNAVNSSVVDGSLTRKQADAIQLAYNAGNFAVTYVASTRTQTTTYYRRDGATPIATSVLVFDTSGRTVSKTVTYSNLP